MAIYQIIIDWNYTDQDDLTNLRDLAALGIGYEEEVPSAEDPGILIPNPISKVQAIKNALIDSLENWILRGTAITADQHRVDELKLVKTRINITST